MLSALCSTEVVFGMPFCFDSLSRSGYSALLVRSPIKAKFACRSVGVKKEEKADKKDDAKKSDKDSKDEKEGKEKEEQKAGASDRSRASKSGVFTSTLLGKYWCSVSCCEEVCSSLTVANVERPEEYLFLCAFAF